MRTPFLSP